MLWRLMWVGCDKVTVRIKELFMKGFWGWPFIGAKLNMRGFAICSGIVRSTWMCGPIFEAGTKRKCEVERRCVFSFGLSWRLTEVLDRPGRHAQRRAWCYYRVFLKRRFAWARHEFRWPELGNGRCPVSFDLLARWEDKLVSKRVFRDFSFLTYLFVRTLKNEQISSNVLFSVEFHWLGWNSTLLFVEVLEPS